jgi:hypothetical protein
LNFAEYRIYIKFREIWYIINHNVLWSGQEIFLLLFLFRIFMKCFNEIRKVPQKVCREKKLRILPRITKFKNNYI